MTNNYEKLRLFYNELYELHKNNFPDWEFAKLIYEFMKSLPSSDYTMIHWKNDTFLGELEQYFKEYKEKTTTRHNEIGQLRCSCCELCENQKCKLGDYDVDKCDKSWQLSIDKIKRTSSAYELSISDIMALIK